MKIFKSLSIILFIVAAVIIGGLAFFVATFDANHYKQQIISLVNKQTGRELAIDGDLKLAVYPDIALKMGKTSLSNAKGFTDSAFATIDGAQVSVELLPLLKKTIKVDEVRLNGLNLNLHRKANGSNNWDDLAGKSDKKQKDSNKPPAKVVEEMLNNLSIAGINLKDAHIHWRDDQSAQDITLSPLNLKTGTFKPGKALPVDLSLTMQQKDPATTINAKVRTAVTLSKDNTHFSLADLKLHTEVTGAQLPDSTLVADLSGTIQGSPEKITSPDLQLRTTLNGKLIPEGQIQTILSGNLDFDVNAQRVRLAGMKVDSKINGKPLQGGNLHALVTGDTNFNLAKQQLAIPNLIVDATMTGGMLQKGKAHSKIAGDLAVNLAKSQLTVPNLTMNTELKGKLIPGGTLTKQAQGKANINWASKQGSIDLSSLLVKLANLELQGSAVQIQPLAEKPSVSGQFQTNTFNLKQVLKTLGIAAPATKNPQALSKVQANFKLDTDADHVTLKPLTLKLDDTTISGKLSLSNFSQPALRPDLTIDHINVDNYLAPEGKAAASTSSASSGDQELLPLEMLRTLDIEGGIDIGSMIINKLKLSQIKTGIKAQKGLIKINPANASLYKGKYQGQITVDARQPTPTLSMHHELVGLRSEGLLFDLFQDKYISGDTRLVTEMSSRGNTLDALLKNLNGTTSISFKDGTIRDSRLAQKTALAVKAFEKKEIKGDKSVVTFTGLSGDFKTTNGVFKTDNLSLKSPYLNISGAGTADVAQQRLDITLRIGSAKQKGDKALYAPLRIYGSFTDPKFQLKLDDLLKSLAQQDLDKAKQKAKEQLEQKKKELQDRIAAEKAAKKQQLQKKLDEQKAKALQKIEKNIGNKLGDKLKQQLGGDNTPSAKDATDSNQEAPASVEDKVKDKLNNKLKGLF